MRCKRNDEVGGRPVPARGRRRSGEVLVEIDPRYFRPTEVDALLGDPSKACAKLGWRHRTSFDELVKEMVDADMVTILQEQERINRHD